MDNLTLPTSLSNAIVLQAPSTYSCLAHTRALGIHIATHGYTREQRVLHLDSFVVKADLGETVYLAMKDAAPYLRNGKYAQVYCQCGYTQIWATIRRVLWQWVWSDLTYDLDTPQVPDKPVKPKRKLRLA